MNIHKILDHPRFRLERREPAPANVVKAFLKEAPSNLPVKYVHFMQASDGASGDIPYDSGHIDIWPLEDLIENEVGKGVNQTHPGFFAFASDGEGRTFVFDIRDADGAPVLSIANGQSTPGNGPEQIAPSFSHFLEHIALMQGGA
jgi:hypothetical protein